MPPKKKGEGITNAEKQRLYRERRRLMHPEKEEANKLKDRERYHSKKKLINDLSEREKRNRRKNTREKVKNFREKQKKISDDTVPPVPSKKSSKTELGRKKVRRDRTKLFRENQLLKKQLEVAKRKANMHCKRAQRMVVKLSEHIRKTPDIQLTPKSLTQKTVHKCFRNGLKEAKQKVARKLFLHNVMSAAIKKKYSKSSTLEKNNFKQAVSQTLLKYHIMRPSLAMYLGLKRGFRGTSAVKEKECRRRKKAVETFFGRDDNSRATSGKKETKTKNKEKRQKRFMNDSIKGLHQKYIAEGNKMSYETFRSHRPFHIVNPTNSERDSCLCELHENLNMKVMKLTSLKICSDSDINNLISLIVCDKTKKDCMYRKCNDCASKEVLLDKKNDCNIITWFEWTRVLQEIENSNGEKKIIKKVIKEKKSGSEEDLCKKFQEELKKFCKHDFNIKHQYAAYRQCCDNLKTNEAMILIDFSQNYACKMGKEIQSYHFGGSRNQVTLHTGVLYVCSQSEPISFCSISSDRRHTPAAIWAHLEPVFKMIRKILPSIEILHFFSDGPTTQYRQKQNFYLLNNQLYYYGFQQATWNFFEAGHGKGAADGVGAALKRKADKIVSFGQDITNANQFYEAVKESKIKMFLVEEQDIDFIEQSIPTNLKTLKGTMKIHQISTVHKAGTLSYRDLSCFCGEQRGFCSCFKCQKFDLQTGTKEKVGNKSSQPGEHLEQPGPVFAKNDDTEVTENKLQKGTFLLVEFVSKKKKFYYVAVTQDDLEDDGEVRVMFLKICDDTGTLFKADDTDIAYVKFDQIKNILPLPEIVQKGDRLFYKFPYSISVFEK